MDDKYIEKETKALEAIVSYMKKELNKNVIYKSAAVKARRIEKIVPPSKQTQEFWEICSWMFSHRVNDIFTGQRTRCELISEKILMKSLHRKKAYTKKILKKRASRTGSFKRKSSKKMHSAKRFPKKAATENCGSWVEGMQLFQEAYQNLKNEYCISSEQESKFDKLFLHLCNSIENTRKGNVLRGSALESINFTFLPYMLDLQKKSIRELLPYLLTAYTFNFWHCHFFYDDKDLIHYICFWERSSNRIDNIDAPKKRARIKKLGQVFSLKNCKDNLILLPKVESNTRPEPFYALFDGMDPQEIKSPYVRYKEILDYVFQIWCQVISECAPLTRVKLHIDWESCQKLYSFYTNAK